MIEQIRQGVFETNSSSTHSICIAKVTDLKLPESLYFSLGEFGWEESRLDTDYEKASYLYTAFKYTSNEAQFEKVVALLEEAGVKVEIEETEPQWYYIDHTEYLGPFMQYMSTDKDKLLSFLFSGLSFILTGNDNNDSDVDVNVNYPHEVLYKGN
jgi:hypothetical protein